MGCLGTCLHRLLYTMPAIGNQWPMLADRFSDACPTFRPHRLRQPFVLGRIVVRLGGNPQNAVGRGGPVEDRHFDAVPKQQLVVQPAVAVERFLLDRAGQRRRRTIGTPPSSRASLPGRSARAQAGRKEFAGRAWPGRGSAASGPAGRRRAACRESGSPRRRTARASDRACPANRRRLETASSPRGAG